MSLMNNPNLMTLYHVLLETVGTQQLIVSYEIATPDFDYVDIAKAHLQETLADPNIYIYSGGSSSIGHHPIGDGSPVVVEWEYVVGPTQ